MPVPRRFDRQPPERDTTRINERIRVPEVRLIDETGAQVGVMKTAQALRYAQDKELDLVEVAAEARPPVCRILDYSKYKYEQAQKQKAARKHQQNIVVREIKFRPKIAQHDYDTKKGHVERFLKHRDKVKVTIMFRGREVAHPERGEMILNRLAEELTELGVVEQRPQQDGRNMTMMLAPLKTKEPTTGGGGAGSPAKSGGGSRRDRAKAAAADGAAPRTPNASEAEPVATGAVEDEAVMDEGTAPEPAAAEHVRGDAAEPVAEPAPIAESEPAAEPAPAAAPEPAAESEPVAEPEPAAAPAAPAKAKAKTEKAPAKTKAAAKKAPAKKASAKADKPAKAAKTPKADAKPAKADAAAKTE